MGSAGRFLRIYPYFREGGMEIRTDISAPIRAQTVKQPVQPAQQSSLQQNASASQIQTPGMREFADALTIMQTAGAIVQQALNVAAKLHNMAQATITTGTVNTQEITNNLAEVKGAIQQQGMPQAIIAPILQNKPAADFLPADKELTDMTNMAKAGTIDKDRLAEITSSLEDKNRAVTKGIDETASKMGAAGFRYETPLAPAADMTKSIVGNPAAAMTAQGNIRPEAAVNLLG
jgi:hypothetical protein